MKHEAKINITRRQFCRVSTLAGLGVASIGAKSFVPGKKKNQMKLGLVTYQWAKDWDLPTIIKNCEAAGLLGVELRTQHAHKVEPNLTAIERKEVKKRFADSKVICLGYGSNQEYHSPDAKILRGQIEGTFELIKLCHDIGATGVKVKPNDIPLDVPREKTIEQIGKSLNEVGKFAADYGQLIRVEVHGQRSSELPNMKAIFDIVDQPNVKICWNSNVVDLKEPGLEANFNMVKKWIGDTSHVKQIDKPNYPYQELFKLFSEINYNGWFLLEETTTPEDTVAAMIAERKVFEEMIKGF